jgi:uncharacterized membrane protein YvbJ
MTTFFKRTPEANDGVCPFCGHQNGPRFGAFRCENCGKYVTSDSLQRGIQTMTPGQWIKTIAGGLAVALALVALGLATRTG